MKYTGRVVAVLTLFAVILVWHSSYFLIDRTASATFFVDKGFQKYAYYYTLLLVLLVWWLGKQYDKAVYYSENDALTKLFNRRYVLDVFKKVTAAADKDRKKVSVSIIDVNNFKAINDMYGHDVGDKALQHMSKSLTDHAQKSDIVARWGGDEFLVIAPLQAGSRIQPLRHPVDYSFHEVSLDISVKISTSIGTAIYPDDADNLEDLIKKADHHMYRSKVANAGKPEKTADPAVP